MIICPNIMNDKTLLVRIVKPQLFLLVVEKERNADAKIGKNQLFCMDDSCLERRRTKRI